VLAQFYTALKEADPSALEIIFVTSDQDEEAFQGYFGEQPWTSIDYSEESVREALGQKCGVRGIPSFQIINPATGEVVDADGRSTVMNGKNDPKGTAVQWAK
jgi:nucleoredoxin